MKKMINGKMVLYFGKNKSAAINRGASLRKSVISYSNGTYAVAI